MLCFRNVNEAFNWLIVEIAREEYEREESRNGPVYRFEPMIWRYSYPRERVLFNSTRNANPFFHMYEAMWMLAGRNDLASVQRYCQQMKAYSDDGIHIHDAYGYRWRKILDFDQLDDIVAILKADPNTRRAVLQMWTADVDLSVIRYKPESKAVPCNMLCTFECRQGRLNMTVYNRSNDLLWGGFGANTVHFSYLLEYVAARCGLSLGYQYHFSANPHLYKQTIKDWKPETDPYSLDWRFDQFRPLALPEELPSLDDDIRAFAENPTDYNHNTYLNQVAKPMMIAWEFHKKREYDEALVWCDRIGQADWQYAATQWIKRRQRIWECDDK